MREFIDVTGKTEEEAMQNSCLLYTSYSAYE